ncbi:hypothetical protein [Cellulomonas sp. URHD0024]|uniref:hypothetical protein n=1 Tax=Cellulomonas sp. URHD0024 TaxID=1302620 RepID=UPI0003FFE056|nr:hypothetical protein [Cellulomonas sp. URHD0024]
MRSTRLVRTAAGLVGVLVLAAACAQPPVSAAPPPLPGMTPVPVVAAGPVATSAGGLALTAEQIASAFLAAADVPAGWEPRTPPAHDAPATSLGFAAPNALSVDPAPCAEMGLAGTPSAPAVAFARVGFYTPERAYVTEEVSTWPDGSAGAGMITAVRSWMASCPAYKVTSQDGTISSYHLAAIQIPAMGDQVVGLRITGQLTGAGGEDAGTFTLDTAVVAVGHMVLTLAAGGEGTIDPTLFAQLTTTATSKVQAAAGA